MGQKQSVSAPITPVSTPTQMVTTSSPATQYSSPTPVTTTPVTITPVTTSFVASTPVKTEIATSTPDSVNQYCTCSGLADLCRHSPNELTDAQAKTVLTKIINENCSFCQDPKQVTITKMKYPKEDPLFVGLEHFGDVSFDYKKIILLILLVSIIIVCIYLIRRK